MTTMTTTQTIRTRKPFASHVYDGRSRLRRHASLEAALADARKRAQTHHDITGLPVSWAVYDESGRHSSGVVDR